MRHTQRGSARNHTTDTTYSVHRGLGPAEHDGHTRNTTVHPQHPKQACPAARFATHRCPCAPGPVSTTHDGAVAPGRERPWAVRTHHRLSHGPTADLMMKSGRPGQAPSGTRWSDSTSTCKTHRQKGVRGQEAAGRLGLTHIATPRYLNFSHHISLSPIVFPWSFQGNHWNSSCEAHTPHVKLAQTRPK